MSEKLRWKIAHHLNKLQRFCWSDLVIWALGWHKRDGVRLRDLQGGSNLCRIEASTPGCACNCGKFRTEIEGGRS
ncbi:hypothetical protein [Rhodococcus sp. BE178]|uniref:hypothetical protein n=1 Tax=Rhodococcus sp. BE178 TaxID=2817737 RepID=UPI003D25719B